MGRYSRVAVSVDRFFTVTISFIASISFIVLLGIFLFLWKNAFPFFASVPLPSVLTGIEWNPDSLRGPQWGVLALFASSLLVTIGSLALCVPVGFAIAIHLAYRVSKRRRQIIKPLIEMIASIPSVTFGLLGIIIVSPLVASVFSLSNGLCALTACILVAIATLPTIVSISDDALLAVDPTYSQASLALGADEWETVTQVMIPAARSGLLAAVMLGLGRIIGETMIVLMVAGNSHAFPTSFFDPIRPLTATIAIEIKEVVTGSLHWSGLFALACLLFISTFLLNTLADFFIHRKNDHT